MRKKRFLSFLALLCLTVTSAWAQEVTKIAVGGSTQNNNYVPLPGNLAQNYTKCEFVYPATMLTALNGYDIKKMTFGAAAGNQNWGDARFQVFLKEVDFTTISAYSGTDNATTVYEGVLYLLGTSEMEITFTIPYTYHGGNLLIGVYQTVKGKQGGLPRWLGEDATGASVRGSNSGSLDAVTTATQCNFLPKVTFTCVSSAVEPEPAEPEAQAPATVFEVDFSSTPTATTGSMRLGSFTSTSTVMINQSANTINTIRLNTAYNYSANRYVSIKPETGSFQTGDTLLIAVCYSNSGTKTAKADIYAANGTTLLFTTAPGINGQNESGDPVVEKFVLEQDADSLLIGRSGSADVVTYITTLKVLRPAADQAIELTKVGANQWQFTMPAYDVELEVEYYEQVEGVVANQDPDKTSDYWCTYYNPTTNVKVSTAGVSIYKAALSGETLALSKVDGNVIKGGQAVVLKSTVGGELEMEETPDDATGDYTGNELKGTTEAINGNGKIYVLNYTQENGVGFYQLSANGTLGANKAYLEYNGSNARAFFSFGFDDETSGIENTSSTDDTNRGEVYDLQGRQVKQPARGLYIKSGKKVVIK